MPQSNPVTSAPMSASSSGAASTDGRGTYPVESLTLADKIYIYRNYVVAYDVLKGSHDAIASAINEAGQSHPAEAAMGQPDDGSQPTPAFKALVDATLQSLTAAHVAQKQAEAADAVARWQAKHPGVDINAVRVRSPWHAFR